MISQVYKKARVFSQKGENKELLVQSLISFVVRIGGAVTAFLMNIFVARYLGIEQSGFFFLALTIITVLASISRIGGDNVVLKLVSVNSANQNWPLINGIMWTMCKTILIITIPISITLCLFSRVISIQFFQKEGLQFPLFWMSLSLPFFCVYSSLAMAFQGIRKVLYSVSLIKIITPLLLIILVCIFKPLSGDIAALLYLVASVLTVVLAIIWYKKMFPTGMVHFPFSQIWAASLPLWIVAIMQQFVIWGGQVIAGIYVSPAELAQLAVARNTATLLTFILTSINYVSAPRFALMYSQGRTSELKRYAVNTTRLMTAVATPLMLIIWIFPEQILSLFGHSFKGGIWYLRILSLGQYISVISGSVGYLLMMTGHEKDVRNVNIINGVVALILALVLTPLFGAIGSAISTAVAVASINLMALGFVKKRLGFTTLKIW